MKEMTLDKTSGRTKTNTTTQEKVDTGSMVIIGSMGVVSALIGGGAVICFVAALLSEGPLAMIKGFLSAVGLL